MNTATRHMQTKVPQKGYFGLPVSAGIVSPYFTGGLTTLTKPKMSIKFIIKEYLAGGNGTFLPYGDFQENSNNTYLSSFFPQINAFDYDTVAQIQAQMVSLILAEASSKSYTGFTAADILDLSGSFTPAALLSMANNMPQAAIADAPADAVTNYNTVTTLLGALTGAVNTANTKQNDIATKVNSLLAELRTLGLINP